VLGSSRCPEFKETSVQLKALDQLCKKEIDPSLFELARVLAR
jgi:hypothetical protein